MDGTGVLSFAISTNPPAADIGQFAALARSNPGKLNYASSGNGTPQHFTMELLKLTTCTAITHGPYKAAPQSTKDLAGGYEDTSILPDPTASPMLHADKRRPLARTSNEPSSA